MERSNPMTQGYTNKAVDAAGFLMLVTLVIITYPAPSYDVMQIL